MKVRIILVDDHRIVREALKNLLSQDSTFDIVGEADDGWTAIELTRKLSPDLVIMDVGMPDLNGIEATRKIVAMSPNTNVLALSMHSDKRFVAQMFKAGAKGYILKDCAFEELLRAMRTVLADRIYISPGIAGGVVENLIQHSSKFDSSAFATLTQREREVLQVMTEGKTTKETASFFNVSVKTIETHRQQIMNKLNIHSIAELTKYAIREGITSL
ncbi:MAG: response regulator transcription factor [Candidatus Omnitrophota bacterium]